MENVESKLSLRQLRIWYFQYKDTAAYSIAISLLILLGNFILFSYVVRPQYDVWQADRQKVKETEEKIAILKRNNDVLATLDPNKLSEDLQVALATLPREQDFAGIMNAIASAATNASVTLEDYTFTLGKLEPEISELVPVTVAVGVNATAESLNKYMYEIQQKVPMANLAVIDGTGGTTTVTVKFFTKTLPFLHLTEEEFEKKVTQELKTPSESQKELLQKLYGYQQAVQISEEDFSGSASASADPF